MTIFSLWKGKSMNNQVGSKGKRVVELNGTNNWRLFASDTGELCVENSKLHYKLKLYFFVERKVVK